MAGRPPKPSKIRKLHGNPSKRPLNDAEPEPKPPAKPPTPPTWLGKEAKKEYRRVAKELFALGLLTELDRTALAAYAVAYERWVKANAGIEEHSLVLVVGENCYMQQSPYVAIANAAAKEMKSFLTEFGMTPSARSRLRVEKPAEEDPFEAFQKSKRRSG